MTTVALAAKWRAGFVPRLLATAVDLLIVAVVYAALISVFAQVLPFADAPQQAGVFAFSVVALVYTSMEMFVGATFGKLLFRLRIRGRAGLPADGGTLLLRWSTKQSPWILMFINAILPHAAFAMLQGFLEGILACGLLAILNDDRLSWHDEWSGTAVWKV